MILTLKRWYCAIASTKAAFAFSLLLLFGTATSAQQMKMTGSILDSLTRESLPGVSIKVKGSTNGTASNANGQYSITVAPDAILVITYIGYQPKELRVSNAVSDILLQPQGFELEDVVVVGTRIKKSDLTGAIGSISEKQLKEIPTTDLTTAMQ